MIRPSHDANGSTRTKGANRLVGAALLASLLAFVTLKYLGTINGWKATHWLFSYDLGFVKRGLVGTVAGALAPDGVVTRDGIVWASLAITAVFVVALAALAWPAFADVRQRRRCAMGILALASPGLGFLLSDLGRFDVLCYAAVLVALVAARAAGRFPYSLFLALAVLVLLVHEAALLLALPVLFVAHLHAEGRLQALVDPAQWPGLAGRGAPVLLVFAGILLLGHADLPLRELLARLAARADFAPSPQSAWVLLRGLDSNLAQVTGGESRILLERGLRGPPLGPISFASFAEILPFALAQLGITHALLRRLGEERRAALAALHLCFLAPWPLLLFGVDWGRWVALATAHCATLTLWFAPALPDETEVPLSSRAALAIAVFALLVAGTSYTMEGARGGRVESPWSNVERWWIEASGSDAWERAFVTP